MEQWFPEKDYEYVVSANQTVVNTSDRFDEIKKYKELLDNGIISNEEFEIKKKELDKKKLIYLFATVALSAFLCAFYYFSIEFTECLLCYLM